MGTSVSPCRGLSCVTSNTPGTGVLSFLTDLAYSENSPPLPPRCSGAN